MKISAIEILRVLARYDSEGGLCDQRDNNGAWYQSAELAAWLIEARKLLAGDAW